jgi:orotate phosphoribosyltransferase
MSPAVKNFITLLVESNVMKRGTFTLKSGRTSNFFIDFGSLESGAALSGLGACYADKIASDIGVDTFDVIFGPTYKGIPIALATAMALHEKWGVTKHYCFNRKEEKGHGEGGVFLGRTPRKGDRVLIVDDVVTDGGTKVEMINLLRATTEAEVIGILVGVDRSETGAVETFEREVGVPLWAIATARELQEASS